MAAGLFFLFFQGFGFLKTNNQSAQNSPAVSFPQATDKPNQQSTPSFKASPTPTPLPTSAPVSSVLLKAPFIVQAPDGEWNLSVYQNGCEEASIMTAWYWLQGKTAPDIVQAKQEIIAITNFEDKTYGPAPDRSAADTAKLLKDYYGYRDAAVKYNISAEDIKSELFQGHLVIVPVNGQKLKNPFYTPPGPLRHMLVIIGYDDKTTEFITNDVGTRHGEKYRYSQNVMENALQDYPTGDHLTITQIVKAMIAVKPE